MTQQNLDEQKKAAQDLELNLIRQIAHTQRQNPNMSDGSVVNALSCVIGRTLAVSISDPDERQRVMESVWNIAHYAMAQEDKRQSEKQ